MWSEKPSVTVETPDCLALHKDEWHSYGQTRADGAFTIFDSCRTRCDNYRFTQGRNDVWGRHKLDIDCLGVCD